MPVIVLLFALLLLPVVMAIAIPFGIVQRYRAGTARRKARSWLAAVNAFFTMLSALIFLGSAVITNIWIPGIATYAAIGIALGMSLGLAGLLLTRWHKEPGNLEYTPNRLLVLLVTTAIAARVSYGLWRGWSAWHSTPDTHSWLAEARLSESLGLGGVVIGYYAAYWLGIWRVARRGNSKGRSRN